MTLHSMAEANRIGDMWTYTCRCGAEFASTDRELAAEAYRLHLVEGPLTKEAD